MFVPVEDVRTSAVKIKLRQNLANGEYDGYIHNAISKLLPRLPKGWTTREDCVGWMQVYTLEAIDKYNPNSPAKFTTFLYKHLFNRSLGELNFCWSSSRNPGKQVYSFSHICQESETSFDPIDIQECRTVSSEIKDLLDRLSVRSQQLLSWMFDVSKDADLGPDLLAAFRSKHRIRKLSRYTGLSSEEIKTLVAEVQDLAPLCVSGV